MSDLRDVAQPGSAHAWGAWGRRFKSSHPDLNIWRPYMSVVLRRAVPFTVLAVGLVAASGLMVQGRASAAPAIQDNSGFPDGDSKKFVLDNCGGCHDLDQVKTAKHNEAAWKETLNHMATYGANITDAQVPTVAAYLAKAFPV